MKYKVINLRFENDMWTGVLESWEGCYCSRNFNEFSIEGSIKPTLKEIIYAANL